jgi:hypothetical protein
MVVGANFHGPKCGSDQALFLDLALRSMENDCYSAFDPYSSKQQRFRLKAFYGSLPNIWNLSM